MAVEKVVCLVCACCLANRSQSIKSRRYVHRKQRKKAEKGRKVALAINYIFRLGVISKHTRKLFIIIIIIIIIIVIVIIIVSKIYFNTTSNDLSNASLLGVL